MHLLKKQKSWKSEMKTKDFSVLPAHVGVIMDGNGRWAKLRGLPRSKGHLEGAKTFRKIGEYAGNLGIRHIFFYAFSTENWSRHQEKLAMQNHNKNFL